MFISTVRTRHLIDISNSLNNSSECDGNGGDFGFLSDSKLLNTALTRAQSLVVVVGDPVALCAIGECVNIWKTYIKHCQNMRSLYPPNHDYESIKQQVQDILMSPDRQKLLELANQRQMVEFLPVEQPKSDNKATDIGKTWGQKPNEINARTQIRGTETSESQGNSVLSSSATTPRNSKMNSTTSTLTPPPPLSLANFGSRGRIFPAPLSFLNQRKVESFIELGVSFTVNPDDVVYQLAKTVVMERNPEKGDKVDKNLIKIGEESNHAVLYYNTARVLTSSSAPDNFDESTACSLLSNPEKYVHCVLQREEDVIYANIIGRNNFIGRLLIPNRWFTGQANINDEVVVEIISIGTEMYGKVVGILKRAVDLRNRYIVCQVGDTSSIMVPLDSNLAPMFNLTTETLLHENKAGNVTVYKFTKSAQIRFSHFERIVPNDPCKLFVVKFLKWDRNIGFPLCVVVGVIPVGADVCKGLEILDLQHRIDKSPDNAVVAEVHQMYPENFQFTPDLLNSREDLRATWCFSIDQADHEISDRAFSIGEVGEDSYLVGVHFSDVAALVLKDSSADIDASNRATAVYPLGRKPVPLFPAILSSQICNFLINQDRLAISVLMTVQRTGQVKSVHVERTLINVKKRFTFKEAEEALHDPNAHQDYLKSCVFVLFEFSQIWRKERLGNAASYQENYHEKISPLSQQLVQELVIMTEYHIASKIFNRFRLATPLCVQFPPQESSLNSWKQEYAADAINSIALTKPFLDASSLETCRCCLACTHTVKYVRQTNVPKRDYTEVLVGTWDNLYDAVSQQNFAYMQNAIVAAENHPQLAVALMKLQRIQGTPKLTCSFNVMEGIHSHYSLNKPVYTYCTQPLSRFIDIVVQRMLIACIESRTCPYTQKEIDMICEHYSNSCIERQKYEDQVFCLHLSSALLKNPLTIQAVIEAISPENVRLCVTALPAVSFVQLDLSDLGTWQYFSNQHDGGMTLKWRERIYDLAVLQTEKPVGGRHGELNPDRFIYKIPAFQWQRLLIAIREQNEDSRFIKLQQAIETVRKEVVDPGADGSFLEEVTSEAFLHERQRKVAEFSLEIHGCQVLQVQMSAKVTHGILSPCVQLLNLTPRLDVCLQHRQHPHLCFTDNDNITDTSALVMNSDVTSYQKVWSALTEMEAATRSVSSDGHITIQNVSLTWKNEVHARLSKVAQFSIPLTFLTNRGIKIDSENQLKQLQHAANTIYYQAYFSDFLCIRYSNILIPADPALHDSLSVVVNNRSPITWVGHGKVTSVALENKMMTFELQLMKSDVPLPLELIKKHPCTIELMERTEIDRYVNIILCSDVNLKKVDHSLCKRTRS